MKHIFTLILTVFISSNLLAQEFGVTKKFFTTENIRVAAAIGYDLSWAGSNGKSGLINASGNPSNDSFTYGSSANQTITAELDVYDATSILGFMGGIGYNTQKYSILGDNGVIADSINTTNIEIPLYLKARFGNALSRSQFWLAAGGGYLINSEATVIKKNVLTGIEDPEVDAKSQFNSLPFVSAMVGYEFMLGNAEEELNRDTYRFLFYGKVNYDLGNRIDNDGIIADTALENFSTPPDYKFVRISFGLKILLRLSKAGELLNDTLRNTSQN